MVLDTHLTESEISQLDVAKLVHEYVLWFKISVQNVKLV